MPKAMWWYPIHKKVVRLYLENIIDRKYRTNWSVRLDNFDIHAGSIPLKSLPLATSF